jgi:predicted Zn-ribbon and HTH transcriptional regulator
MIIVAVWAWALPWTAALGFTRLSGRSRYVRVAAMALPMILSTELTIVVLIEEGNEAVARVLGVTAILVVLGTIITPVLQKLAGLSRRDGVQTTKLQLDLTCPRCGLEQRLPSGPSRCGQCRLKFRIDIEEPVCPTCGYVLHQLTQPTCPECGTALAPEEITRVDRSADAESAAEASR